MKITKEERMRRLLIHFYEERLRECNDGTESLPDNLVVLDACKDCITGDEDGMTEWSISPQGKIRFK